MNKKLIFFRIASSLIFALVAVVLTMATGGFSLLQSLGIAVLLCALQYAFWKLTRKRGLISYALAFVPSCGVVVALVRAAVLWYGFALGAGLAIMFIPGKKLPLPRPSTSIWVGVLLFMVIVSLTVGLAVA